MIIYNDNNNNNNDNNNNNNNNNNDNNNNNNDNDDDDDDDDDDDNDYNDNDNNDNNNKNDNVTMTNNSIEQQLWMSCQNKSFQFLFVSADFSPMMSYGSLRSFSRSILNILYNKVKVKVYNISVCLED